ncbi:MAG: hemolysin III family protein [Simkaniaceae bacterium]|nr:hemolysin III family protein [Simkaniaceae bacterium]
MNSLIVTQEKCPISGQSFREEVANTITHGIGFVFSIAGLVILSIVAYLYTNPLITAGAVIYGSTLTLLYGISTLYHMWPSLPTKRIFRILDHVCIYLLIAGTYTPFTFGPLRGPWGWTLFGLVWGLAFIGIVVKCFRLKNGGWISTLFYLLMGWLIVIAAKPLTAALPGPSLIWLMAGGLFYTSGTIFYSLKNVPFSHSIWHIFVLLGSICHYASILNVLKNVSFAL